MLQNNSLSSVILPPEWERQDAIVMAWPHRDTDWGYMLNEAEACYKAITTAIVREMPLIVVAPNIEEVSCRLSDIDHNEKIIFHKCDTNDTWARDFGPISVLNGNDKLMLDFKFDAWGMKFAANKDNLVCRSMERSSIFNARLVNCQDFVLEGGSIESDGKGTILTTSRCLLSPNRNSALSKQEIEEVLHSRLGAKKVLWLNHGELAGDDTDAHIDTLARLAPNDTILYVKSDNTGDEQYESLMLMEKELMSMTNADGKPFNLLPLPCPAPIYDEDGERLPATYANYLITNNQVLVPIYGQHDNDEKALSIIKKAFNNRDVVGIDCNALIKQHGSLHCITMQIPENFLKK
ncbi:MAG: agmatine deiminase family protein [Muribaculaceae bacterium]|nr:agmatine deiminase family protein [Muribaculaceae bacterium]